MFFNYPYALRSIDSKMLGTSCLETSFTNWVTSGPINVTVFAISLHVSVWMYSKAKPIIWSFSHPEPFNNLISACNKKFFYTLIINSSYQLKKKTNFIYHIVSLKNTAKISNISVCVCVGGGGYAWECVCLCVCVWGG